MNENYIYYKKLKRSLEGLQYKGYPLDKVLGSYIAMYAWSSGARSLKVLLEILLVRINVNLLNSSTDTTLLTYSIQRNDYLELISGFIKSREFENISVEMLSTRKNGFLEFIALTFLGLFDSVKISNVTLIEKLVLNLLIAFAKKNIDILEKEKCEFSKYIAFNSSFKFESFLSYFFRVRDIKTYSLQHGMYFKYLNDIPIDVINYENICSNTLLCWGCFTQSEIHDYVPADSSADLDIYPRDYSDKIDVVDRTDTIYVLLPRLKYEKEIIHLISSLTTTNLKVLIRPHPQMRDKIDMMIKNVPNFTLDHEKSLSLTLQKNNFSCCLGFNTTALFEAVLFGQKVIQYYSGNDEFEMPDVAKVSNEELISEILPKNIPITNAASYFNTSMPVPSLRYTER
jgi:hypothetical protein